MQAMVVKDRVANRVAPAVPRFLLRLLRVELRISKGQGNSPKTARDIVAIPRSSAYILLLLLNPHPLLPIR